MKRKCFIVSLIVLLAMFTGCQAKSETIVETAKEDVVESVEEMITEKEEATVQLVSAASDLDKQLTSELLIGELKSEYTTVDLSSKEEAVFSGVLLKDLAASLTEEVEKVVVTAVDGYAVVIKKDVWEKTDVMLATHMNGELLDMSIDGPAKIVFPSDAADIVGWENCNEGIWIYQIVKVEFK